MARIAIVLNASWNIWNFRLPLLQYLSDQGHEIIVIAPEDDYSSRIPWEFHHVKMVSRSTNPVTDLLIYKDLKRLFNKTHPDVVLLYTIKPNVYGNFAARQLGIPSISNIAGLGSLFIQQNITTRIAKLLYKFAMTAPVKIFFQNNEDMDQFLSERIVPLEPCIRIPGSGVDLDRFKPAALDDEEGESRPFIFLLFSRMLWDKGVGEYVEVARRLISEGRDVEFRLLGFLDTDNPNAINQQDMDKLCSDKSIVYLGVSDDVEHEIQTADCIVLPTYYREGVPRTLLEAAAMAKPIIATAVPGCRDVVDDGVTGYLCAPRDANDLYQKMHDMIVLDDKERQAMGSLGREKMAKEFDQKFVFEKYAAAINEALLL
ncbi:MAG: glycosyltransferase family 4 protein [Arenicellales bacterium]